MTTAFGLIIVGDEILSGRRQDKHFSKVIELLGARGLQLAWAEFLGDDREALTRALRRTFASGDVVLSCGGIGGTPDDHTRQAAAAALDLPLALHPEAASAIALRTAKPQRVCSKPPGSGGGSSRKWRTIRQSVARHLPEVTASGTSGGSALWLRGPTGTDAWALQRLAARRGVLIEPGHIHFLQTPQPTEYFRLGYGAIAHDAIERDIAIAEARRSEATNNMLGS